MRLLSCCSVSGPPSVIFKECTVVSSRRQLKCILLHGQQTIDGIGKILSPRICRQDDLEDGRFSRKRAREMSLSRALWSGD